MERKEFLRSTPEETGVSSESILRFLDRMDDRHTEMHSLMIMRFGKVIAEGWWAPYAPGLRHSMMSTSKTFTGTAIGLAADEGILSLDEKIVNIFPEYVPQNASDYLKKINIRHLLTMSSGMEETCVIDENYILNFMNTPVIHEPGTDFFYNDSAVSLLPAIIYKKTGQQLLEFLKSRLFDKIGIDVNNLTWFNISTGNAFGAGGLHCTTEDALRLMKLYANHGIWNGEVILSQTYIQEATRPYIMTNTKTEHTIHLPKDNQYGYGYLMWMGSKKGTYRSEGAFGQITLVDQEKDLIISFTEANYSNDPASQESMNRCWEFINQIDKDMHILPENLEKAKLVNKRFHSLAVEHPPFNSYGMFINEDRVYESLGDGAHPENLFYNQVKTHPIAKTITGITSFSLKQIEPRLVKLSAVINNEKRILIIPTDGSGRLNYLPEYYKTLVYTSGYWKDKFSFAIRFRWIETVFHKELVFTFQEEQCIVTELSLTKRITESKATKFTMK